MINRLKEDKGKLGLTDLRKTRGFIEDENLESRYQSIFSKPEFNSKIIRPITKITLWLVLNCRGYF